MAMGYGLSGLSQSPGLESEMSSAIEQFTEWLRSRGTGASMGRPAIQAPVGTPPRESAGQLRTAAGEGAATFMQQAGETAAEPWKPQALDIALIAASVAGPIIAALQPEGKGRRGQRKQQRMSKMFKGLGELAQKGVGLRKGSFEAGKKATFGAAQEIAGMSVEEAEAQYGRTIGDIEAAEGKRRWGEEFGLAERGMAVQERPKAEKAPTWTGLKVGGLGGLSPEEQKDALYPGLAPSKAGGFTEQQRQTNKQKDILNRANLGFEVLHERNAHNYPLDLAAAEVTPVALKAPSIG